MIKIIVSILAFISLSSYSQVETSKTLKVAAYNIKGLPFPIERTQLRRFTAISLSLRAMHYLRAGPDVVLFQESFSVLTNLLWLSLRDIYPNRARGPGIRWRWNSGLEVMSKYPIIKRTNMVFAACDWVDCLARKGVAHVRIRTPAGEVDFYDSHMQANNGLRVFASRLVRLSQATQFVNFVKRTHKPDIPLFIGGDLNAQMWEPAYLVFPLSLGGTIEASRYCMLTLSCPMFNVNLTNWFTRIDHIFYDGPKVRPKDYFFLFKGLGFSDHNMLMTVFKVGKKTPPTNKPRGRRF